jgi:hypothetical protein
VFFFFFLFSGKGSENCYLRQATKKEVGRGGLCLFLRIARDEFLTFCQFIQTVIVYP